MRELRSAVRVALVVAALSARASASHAQHTIVATAHVQQAVTPRGGHFEVVSEAGVLGARMRSGDNLDKGLLYQVEVMRDRPVRQRRPVWVRDELGLRREHYPAEVRWTAPEAPHDSEAGSGRPLFVTLVVASDS